MASFAKKYNAGKKETSDSYDDELDFDDDDDDIDTSNSKSNSIAGSNKFQSFKPAGESSTSNSAAFSAGPLGGKGKKVDADAIIKILLSDRARAIGVTNTELTEDMIAGLVERAQDVITTQPVFLQLSGPVKIVSDIHG